MSTSSRRRIPSAWWEPSDQEFEETVVSTSSEQALDVPYGFAQLTGRLADRGPIGEGGMSHVHLMHDGDLQREIALKVMRPEIAKDPGMVRRFIEEAQITGQLDHPSIPSIHGLGVNNVGTYCFTMDLISGHTLLEIIQSAGYTCDDPNKLFDVLEIFVQVCGAVSFAHSRGVVHCDLKPQNIMVGKHRQVYVTDWGIARLSEARASGADRIEAPILLERAQRRMSASELLGTPGYMAPEQARSNHDDVDERTDVFGLGAVLYQILTLRAPYEGRSVGETITLAANATITPPQQLVPDLPPRLCDIAMRALSASPDDRHDSVEALLREVETFRRGEGIFERCDIAAGHTIIREGESPDNAYIIAHGGFRVTKDGALIKMLRRGDVFGEMAILSGERRAASVEAVEDSTVIVVSQQSIDRQLKEGQTTLGLFVRALAGTAKELGHELTQKSNELEAASLFQTVLLYFNFHGETVTEGTRQAAWGPLRDKLVPWFAPDEEAVTERLGQIGSLTLDAEANVITLRTTDLGL